ncbi:putative long-chain-fatty-acid--CoA ligase [Ylistrum balloti]|uniref:putative long-chain-fatty-acid--CoA ligase n=1 Tax=Ylistrum balloti TaxID=509963 RepID=UPI002905B76E|nr:putative long-chain-fatty-acid--CoA ligase [Ylistrum balloti]
MRANTNILPLERAFQWSTTQPNRVYMTQPMGEGIVKEYTWSQTIDEAKRIAAYIKSFNFEPGSNIAILSKNCAHFIMTDLAIWMAGHTSVAIYPTLNAETVNYILTHCEAKLLFVGKLDTWQDMKPGVPEGLPMVSYPSSPPNDYPTWDTIIAETNPIEENPKRDANETAIIVYTSGSTGTPKGVVHSFHNLAVAALGIEEIFQLAKTDRQLSYLPLAHVFERAVVEIGSLYNSTQLFFAESLDTFIRDLQRARPTLFHSVPRLWLKFQLGVFKKMPAKKLDRLLKIPVLNNIIKKKVLKGLGLDACRLAISGSAPIPPDLINWYRKLGLELLEAYGMSENFAYSHANLPGKTRIGYVGNTLPGVEHKISDEGEILVKSPADMTGYYKMPEISQASFTKDGFLKTGDRGEIDTQGRLRITGRVKELFKTSKGKYVAPAPIENLINADPHIEQSCVAGSGYPACYALVMLSDQWRGRVQESDIKQQLTETLTQLFYQVNQEVEPHEKLQFMVIVQDEWQIENGFLTPTMKIKRNILEDTYAPKLDSWYSSKEKIIWES